MKAISPQSDGSRFVLDQQWRERFLSVMLQGASLLGLVALGLYLLGPSIGTYKVLAAATYAILVLVTFFTSLSYQVRVAIFLLVVYLSGLISLADYGPAEASLLFLGLIVINGLLFSTRTGMYSAMAISLASILISGWSAGAFSDSLRPAIVLLTVAALVIMGLRTFQEEVSKTQRVVRPALERLQDERLRLEKQLEEKEAGLTRKTEQLRAMSYIARHTADVQDLPALLTIVTRLVTDQFQFYHTGLFLMDETGSQLVLEASSSEGGQRMIRQGHSLSVGSQGLVQRVAAQKKPRIALDVGANAVVFNNPDLPLTRSEVALPLLIRNRLLGVLDIQSDMPDAFGMDDVDVLQTLADQVAVAIDNARLVDETQSAITQLEALTSVRTYKAWSQRLRGRGRTFTYTPLGLRAEKIAQANANAISAPIILRGRKIGDISIAKKGSGKWSRLDESLLTEVASQVGLAIDNIRLLEEATERARQEQLIGKLATRFSQSLDLDTLLQTAARELGQLPDVAEVSVFVDQAGGPTSQSTQPPNPNAI